MSEIHQIGELLQAGAKPSQEEAEQLSELGAFVAALYGRYLHGTVGTESLTSHTDSFASSIGGRLGAETSTRWEHGLGLSEQLMSSEWSSWWQVASQGFRTGYDYAAFDLERAGLELYEDAPAAAAEAEPEIVRARRGSLFGVKGHKQAPARRRAPAAVRQAALAGAPSSRRVAATGAGSARWIDGGFVELATVEALERGGLFLGDQLLPVAEPRAQRAPARRPSLLDGLLVDDRTPALSSALQWAEAVFGHGAGADSLSINADRIAAMTAATSGPMDHGRGALQRPVFAFFDAVQGDFLNLEPEATATATVAEPARVAAPSARPSLFATTSAPATTSTPAQPTRRAAQRQANVTSIDRLVRAVSGSSTSVRPYTGGVFPTMAPRAIRTAAPAATTTSVPAASPAATSRPAAMAASMTQLAPALQLATQITYTRGGAPQARIQRATNGAPRAAVTMSSSTGIARALERGAEPAGTIGRPVAPARPTAAGRPDTFETVFAATRGGTSSIGRATEAAAQPPARGTLHMPGIAPQWRLAADLGPDLPLGATLGRSEIFGAAASAYAAPQTLLERSGFAPTVARGGGVASGFASSAFTSAVDGVVWVAPEQRDAAAEAMSPVEAAIARMPLAVVPRGRAAAMVPAAVAMELGTAAAIAPRATETMPAPLGRAAAATPTAFDTETRITRSLQSGLVSNVARAPGSPLAAASAPFGLSPMLTPVTLAPIALAVADEQAALAPGSPTATDVTAPIARVIPTLGTVGDVARPLGESRGPVSRWAEQLAQSTTSAPTGFGPGAYARFDTPQEMVALFDAAAPDATVARHEVAGEAVGQRFGGRQQATARPVAAPIVTRLARAGAPVAQRQLQSFPLATRGDAAVPAGAGIVPSDRQGVVNMASSARNALRRPVATARETRSIAPLVAVLRQAAAMSQASTIASEPALSRHVHAVSETRADALVGGAVDAPVTTILEQLTNLGARESRAVMQTLRSAGWTGPELEMLTLSDEGSIDATASEAAPMTRREAVVQLRAVQRAVETARAATRTGRAPQAMTAAAGEAASFAPTIVAPELGLMPTIAAAAGLVAGAPEVIGDTTSALGGRASETHELATAARMGRNLARAVSGTEALGAPVTAGQLAPHALSTVASAQAASFMPILANAGRDAYFGATAPERTAGRMTQVSGLRDAVGELVQMAREVAAVGDTAVEEGAGQRVLGRLVESKTRLDSRRPAVRASVARVLAAGTNERELVTALARVPAAERHEALALARANAPQIIARLEQAVATGATTFEGGLADLIAGRTLPTLGIDATMAATAPEAPTRRFTITAGALDATYVEPATETREGLEAADVERTGFGLGDRLTTALRQSMRGPASARRLLQPLAQPTEPARAQALRGAERKALSLSEASVPMDLASVMAPEAMLGGLRSHELSQAMSGLEKARSFRGEAPGVFATFADSGVDMASPTATVLGDPAVSRRAGAAEARTMTRAQRADMAQARRGGETTTPVQPMRARASLFKSDPVQVLLQLVGRDPAAAEQAFTGGGDGISRRGRAGLFSAIMRGADRREVASLFQQAGASDFAFAWLSRVDGTRSGLDIGLGGARAELGRTFGSRTTSTRVAQDSPIQQASFVSTAEGPSRGDRSGLRSLAAHAGPTRASGARPRHGASAALRRTDWRFVETGSRAQTAHADLGKLASAIVSNSQSASRAPLPLIAPAAKAVAQTALRSANTEARPGGQTKSSAKPGGDGAQKQPQAGLSEQALEQLAIEMASRVAQIMGRNKERIGVWH